MLNLLRKEWMVSRRVHIVALFVCLGMVFIAKAEPKSALFVALFANLMYTHTHGIQHDPRIGRK
jgi:hypothetical protein